MEHRDKKKYLKTLLIRDDLQEMKKQLTKL
jgi:hypothetical protein